MQQRLKERGRGLGWLWVWWPFILFPIGNIRSCPALFEKRRGVPPTPVSFTDKIERYVGGAADSI